jgi:hypothetical protein
VQQLTECGCVQVAEWYLDENGKVKLDYPASIANVPGVLIIANKEEVMMISSTSHYGPMIRDFIGAKTGDTTHALTNQNIAAYLDAGNTDLMLWRKDDPDPHAVKAELKSLFSSKWSS